jgi:hypothetical protein
MNTSKSPVVSHRVTAGSGSAASLVIVASRTSLGRAGPPPGLHAERRGGHQFRSLFVAGLRQPMGGGVRL